MDTLLDLLSEYYPKVLGNFILEYYYNGKESIYNIYDNIYNQCKQGVIALINIDGLNKYGLNYGLTGACDSGYMKIVKLMIKKGASDFNRGLSSACSSGNMKITKLIIEKGAIYCFWCSNTKHPELLHKN